MYPSLYAALLVGALGVIAQDRVSAYHFQERRAAHEAGAGHTATLRFTAPAVLTHLMAGAADMSRTAGAFERGTVARLWGSIDKGCNQVRHQNHQIASARNDACLRRSNFTGLVSY